MRERDRKEPLTVLTKKGVRGNPPAAQTFGRGRRIGLTMLGRAQREAGERVDVKDRSVRRPSRLRDALRDVDFSAP